MQTVEELLKMRAESRTILVEMAQPGTNIGRVIRQIILSKTPGFCSIYICNYRYLSNEEPLLCELLDTYIFLGETILNRLEKI